MPRSSWPLISAIDISRRSPVDSRATWTIRWIAAATWPRKVWSLPVLFRLYRNRQGSIDLVLLDLNMPLMGGKETFEQLRSINPKLRIIILTGYGESAIQNGFPGAADSFIQKPFQLEDLAVKIRHVLDARKSTARLVS